MRYTHGYGKNDIYKSSASCLIASNPKFLFLCRRTLLASDPPERYFSHSRFFEYIIGAISPLLQHSLADFQHAIALLDNFARFANGRVVEIARLFVCKTDVFPSLD